MSLQIDELLSYSGITNTTSIQGVSADTNTVDTSEKDRDSYISSVTSSEGAIPCENYNDILQIMKSAQSQQSGTATDYEDIAKDSKSDGSGEMAPAAGAGGGSDESDSEDETTTEIVVIDGVTYLETTTVSNGITTVNRTVISGGNADNKE